MSTRDELILALCRGECWDTTGESEIFRPDFATDALIAEGWRKMPSRDELARAIASGLDGWNDYDAASTDYKRELLMAADAILALMDGGSA